MGAVRNCMSRIYGGRRLGGFPGKVILYNPPYSPEMARRRWVMSFGCVNAEIAHPMNAEVSLELLPATISFRFSWISFGLHVVYLDF